MTPQAYYADDANWGSGQYTTMKDIINNFMLMYVGPDKQLDNVARHEIIFHAKQAIKMLHSDAMKSHKAVEYMIGDDLKFILPPDYVDYIRISINVNGELRVLSENRRANTAARYSQDAMGDLIFDIDGEVVTETSQLDLSRVTPSIYYGPGDYNGCYGWYVDDCWYFGYPFRGMYGLDPSEVSSLPTFMVNNGVIDFSSGMANQLVVVEYTSDGMMNGDDSKVVVHKYAEEFTYRYIKWALLNQKASIPVYDRKLARDEKHAELRNAKIRLSGLHPSRLLMSLRGQNKWIK